MGRSQNVHPMEYASDERSSSPELESLNCCQLKVHRKKIIRERQKRHHLDPTYNGPLKNRSCTDIICLFLFIVFIAAWVALGIYAFSSGSPGEIFAPRNSESKKCGYDSGLEDKPDLVFFDLTACVVPGKGVFRCETPQVCVKECPQENFYFDYYYKLIPEVDAKFLASKLICLPNTNLANLDRESLKQLVASKTCASWYLQSVQVAHRCLPDVTKFVSSTGDINIEIDNGSGQKTNTTVPGVTGSQVNDGSLIIQYLSSINEFWQEVARDLMETWPWILLCIGGSMLVSLLYICIMRWVAGLMVWFSLIAAAALLAYCSYISWTKYDEIHNNRTEMGQPATLAMRSGGVKDGPDVGEIIKDALEKQLDEYLRMETTWLVFFIAAVVLLVVLLLIIIFLRNRIRLAVSLINEGSRAVAHSWSTLFFPIFPWLLQVGVICYAVAICLFLFSSGVPVYRVTGLQNDTTCHCTNSYKDGDYCFPEIFAKVCSDSGQLCQKALCDFAQDDSHNFSIYLQLYNLFIFFWTLFFVAAVGQMILSSTFATYYWTFHKSDIPFFIVATSAWRVIRYHLGTAAFGSLLLALVSWLRALLEIADAKLKKYDNEFVKAIKCCMRCFFWCLEKFLRFLNKNAYIMCAIHGKNFCSSARDAFSLLLRNILRVFVLDKVTDFLFFISKLVITAAVGAASFYIFTRPTVNLQDINGQPYTSSYSFVPIVFTVVGTYFIASIFFNVYSMAVDTLFLCFLEDCDVNDGSTEKPYFMSKNLMSILGKKNKLDKATN